MEWFSYNKKEQEKGAACVCKKKGLFLDTRQLSFVVAAFILLLFFTFMSGYFLGHKKAVTTFSHKLDQDSFADRIYSSMFSLYDGKNDDDYVAEGDACEQEMTPQQGEEQQAYVEPPADMHQEEVAHDVSEQPSRQYYAQLAGFGTVRVAQRLADRLQQKNMPVILKKRRSRTAKGRMITWYQVVTDFFTDRAALDTLVNTIKKQEKLKDVRIVTC